MPNPRLLRKSENSFRQSGTSGLKVFAHSFSATFSTYTCTDGPGLWFPVSNPSETG